MAQADTDDKFEFRARPRTIGKRIRQMAPARKWQRQALGIVLVLAGAFFGFLPILGYWMIPLGLFILSIDNPVVRKARRRLEIAWGRWRKRPTKGVEEMGEPGRH